MTIQGIVILLISITQVLSAPSGCIESCSHSIKHFQVGSQTSGSIQNHDLTQTSARLEGLDYSKPGTWSEHNDYNTDNGHGKIHEERGQYVDGSKTVRYYKKNYSSSYNTGYPSGAELSEIEQENRHGVYVPNVEENINSQRTYDQVSNIGSMAQRSGTHSEHRESSIIRGNSRSERLEDLGEYDTGSNTQISQNPFYTNTQPGNWSKVDSYRTDGGHGRVFEEEGQYVTGPKKIRYYKRNYTSSSSSSSGIPTLTTSRIGVHNLDRELENLQREIEQKLKQMSATTNMASSNIAQTNINMHGLTSDSLHNINSNVHRSHVNHGSSLFTTDHDEEQDYIQRTDTDIGPYKSPSQNIKGTRNSNMYENHEVYATNQQPTIGHINVQNTGRSSYDKNIYSGGMTQQHTDNLQQTELLDSQQKKFVDDNLRQNTYNLNSPINSDTLGRFPHYKEQWSSSSHMQEISRPQHFPDIPYINEQNAQYNNRYRENSFHSEHQSKLGKLMSGTLDLSQVGNNADCTHGTIEHVHTSSQHQTMYKRDAKSDESSDAKSDESSDAKSDESSDRQEHAARQLSQQHQDFSAGANADMVQQTDQFDDFTQQTSGKLEFGQQSQSTYPQKPSDQHSEDLTQQTDDFGDFTQQTSGKLEFGQQSQSTYHPQKPRDENQHSEDLTQQTDDFGDFTQQTSGKLEFGQQSQSTYHPQKPSTGNQHSDLTQQTDDIEDLTQQTSGKLQFGQDSQYPFQPWNQGTSPQHSEDLTQQTGEFDDFTQQTSGKLEFGQQSEHSHHPRNPSTSDQHSEDLTQQTDDFGDFTQQTSGKLEFGQQSQSTYHPQKPKDENQYSEDLMQQTGDFEDLTQQTSGKLEFGQQPQNIYHPQKPSTGNQHSDLTQQTGDFEDLTQQTSGKLEFGQQSQSTYHPQKPKDENQHSEDLMQQTGDFEDLTQQTSGKLEFGQQSQSTYHPQKPSDQHSEDLMQQTGDFEDLTQQTSGKLEFGQQSQNIYHPQKPSTGNQHSDLTQQTDDFGDLTQQTSGKLEFGQQPQNIYHPQKPSTGNQHSEDLTQQTGDFEDLIQQTSGKLEFGQQPQNIYHPQKPSTGNQHSDLTQQTDDIEDLTQQTSGKLEFGQDSQYPFQSWNQGASPQYSEDLTQQTGEFDDFTQQTSGKLEFGQQSEHSHHPRKPSTSNQHSEDLTQQTDDFGDLTQQTSGKLEFGQDSQYSYQPWNPSTSNQQSEDLTQQTSKFSGGTSMNGQISENNVQNTNKFPDMSGANDVYGQQYSQQHNLEIPEEPQVSSTPFPKPAEKPKPRSRYSRTGLARNVQDAHNTNSQQTSNPDSSDTYAVNIDNTRNQSRRDQSTNDFMNVGSSTQLSQQAASNVFSVDGGSMDQSNSLHKSNDATVGLQWHYTYHPSDQRTFVQQIEQKDKEDLQQTSSNLEFHQSDHNLDQQETQNTYTFEDAYQQSTNGGNEDLQLSQKYQGESDSMQQSHLEFGQQTVSETDNEQKYVQTSETEHRLEPRILEAYGGGPYDISHDDDIYRGVTINPSATLPPINSADPWDIREKPRVMVGTVNEATPTPMPVEPLDVNNVTTEAPSFWSRVGNRLTNTFGKAKEKARSIFG